MTAVTAMEATRATTAVTGPAEEITTNVNIMESSSVRRINSLLYIHLTELSVQYNKNVQPGLGKQKC